MKNNITIPTTTISDDYHISKIINWWRQLSWGHGAIDKNDLLRVLVWYVSKWVTTFDWADHYTWVEELYGVLRKKIANELGSEVNKKIKIHTKCVPDYDDITHGRVNKQYLEKIIDRSLMRLQQDRLDLVQLHHRNYEMWDYVQVLMHMKELQQQGKIHHIGITNYNTTATKNILDAGVSLMATQNQYSILDQRPEKMLTSLCEKHSIKILPYGVLAGGFLSKKYLWAPEPTHPMENRSLTKYKLIIDDLGWRDYFQSLLQVLDSIAQKYHVSLSDVAMKYIIDKPIVAWIIVGCRNDRYLDRISNPFTFSLDSQDLQAIQTILDQSNGLEGDCYDLERNTDRHKNIMKYNLNKSPDCSIGRPD